MHFPDCKEYDPLFFQEPGVVADKTLFFQVRKILFHPEALTAVSVRPVRADKIFSFGVLACSTTKKSKFRRIV